MAWLQRVFHTDDSSKTSGFVEEIRLLSRAIHSGGGLIDGDAGKELTAWPAACRAQRFNF